MELVYDKNFVDDFSSSSDSESNLRQDHGVIHEQGINFLEQLNFDNILSTEDNDNGLSQISEASFVFPHKILYLIVIFGFFLSLFLSSYHASFKLKVFGTASMNTRLQSRELQQESALDKNETFDEESSYFEEKEELFEFRKEESRNALKSSLIYEKYFRGEWHSLFPERFKNSSSIMKTLFQGFEETLTGEINLIFENRRNADITSFMVRLNSNSTKNYVDIKFQCSNSNISPSIIDSSACLELTQYGLATNAQAEAQRTKNRKADKRLGNLALIY